MNTHHNMKDGTTLEFGPDRIVEAPALKVAGLKSAMTENAREEIPQLWSQLAPHLGRLPAQVGKVAYGVVWTDGEKMAYLAGIEVSTTAGLPEKFKVVMIPAQRYAIFQHSGHVSHLYETLERIHSKWLPRVADKLVAPGGASPSFFERYGEGFDPEKGSGDIEVWVVFDQKTSAAA